MLVLGSAAVIVTAYARGGLLPRMAAAGDAVFGRYHRRPVLLNGVPLLAVGLVLVAPQLPDEINRTAPVFPP